MTGGVHTGVNTYILSHISQFAGLDQWQLQHEQVVINRKVGEGTFGTVYSGEVLKLGIRTETRYVCNLCVISVCISNCFASFCSHSVHGSHAT